MVTQAFWKGFRNRAIVSLALLGVSLVVNISPLERAWSKVLAWTTSNATYVTYGAMGHSGGVGYGVLIETPEGYHIITSSGHSVVAYRYIASIAHECTYISLAAIILSFLVRKMDMWWIVRAVVLTFVWVGILNYLRLRFSVVGSRLGWSDLWSHDIPHYACYTLSILGAVWYYYRSTVPRDAGNNTEASADGSSTMAANA